MESRAEPEDRGRGARPGRRRGAAHRRAPSRAGHLLAWVAVGLLAPATAAGDEPCLERAEGLYREGAYEAAREQLAGCPPSDEKVLLEGHLLWKLHQHEAARDRFRLYAGRAGPRVRRDVERLIEELELLIRTRIAVVSRPAGAVVRLDDPEAPPIGRTPLDLGVAPGPHVLHLSLEGHEGLRLRVVAEAGKSVRAEARLARPSPASRSARPAPRPVSPPASSSPRRRWSAEIALGAVTLASGGVALGLGLSARAARVGYDESGDCALRETIRDRAIAADVMIGITAAAAVATAVLVVLKLKAPRAEARVALGGTGVSVGF